jgi:hypothetical protein
MIEPGKKSHRIMKEIESDSGRVVAFALGASWDCSTDCVPWVGIGTAVEGNGHECLIRTVIPTGAKTSSIRRFGAALGKRRYG